MSDKQTMSYHGSMRVEAAAAYLEALALALRDRHIALASEGEQLDIEVADDLLFDLKTKSTASKGKASLDLTLAWRRTNERGNNNPDLLIASHQAAIAAELNDESLPPPMDE
jgi:amphi-Trp domain-containing protein